MFRSSATLNSSPDPAGNSGPISAAERRAQRLAELADRTKFDDSNVKSFKAATTPSSDPSSRYASAPQPPSYRYANVDRLGERNKIYNPSSDAQTLSDISPTSRLSSTSITSLANSRSATSPAVSARTTAGWTAEKPTAASVSTAANTSTKRDLFFKQDVTASSTTTTPTTNGSISTSATTATSNFSGSRENLLSSTSNKEKEALSYIGKERESKEKHSVSSQYSSTKSVDGYVGFANLPNQVYRKAVKRGFDFTLMVVGESGLGKSTLINSLFLTDIYAPDYPGPSLRIKKTVQVETTKVLLKENGVNLTLTVVDTPGFGDAVDNSNCWQTIIDFVDSKYEDYLNAESRVNRKAIGDSRVHCCLYFIAPSGHGLKPLDIEFMKRLHDKVNIIPVISKADTMTPEECALFKKTILNEIAQHKIKIYEFPDCDDEEDNKIQKSLRERVPFAIVGSNTIIDNNGKKVRGRKYPWGVVEVENLEHCDFIALRNMLVRTHMQDLKDVANNVHYENFRFRKLAGVSKDGKMTRMGNKNPLAQMEDERKEHEDKMKKMEQDMENVFEMKVKEKKQKLKDSEADLQKRHEQMRKNLEIQQKELEEKRKAFLKEKDGFELANKDLEEIYRKNTLENSKDTLDGKEKKKDKKKGLF